MDNVTAGTTENAGAVENCCSWWYSSVASSWQQWQIRSSGISDTVQRIKWRERSWFVLCRLLSVEIVGKCHCCQSARKVQCSDKEDYLEFDADGNVVASKKANWSQVT